MCIIIFSGSSLRAVSVMRHQNFPTLCVGNISLCCKNLPLELLSMAVLGGCCSGCGWFPAVGCELGGVGSGCGSAWLLSGCDAEGGLGSWGWVVLVVGLSCGSAWLLSGCDAEGGLGSWGWVVLVVGLSCGSAWLPSVCDAQSVVCSESEGWVALTLRQRICVFLCSSSSRISLSSALRASFSVQRSLVFCPCCPIFVWVSS